jgi:hypothetical protein
MLAVRAPWRIRWMGWFGVCAGFAGGDGLFIVVFLAILDRIAPVATFFQGFGRGLARWLERILT